MVFGVLLVGDEKNLSEAQTCLNACKRITGPMKIMASHKAHEAVSHLQTLTQTAGRCDVAMLSNHFTAPGKEQFSDALRDVLKKNHPDTPIICWGNPSKGGKKGENYHYGLENLDPGELGELLSRYKAGDLPADYGGKGAGAKGRKSMDTDPRRKSIDSENSNIRKSMDRTASPARLPVAPSMRRQSQEGPGAGVTGRRSLSLWDDGVGGASMSEASSPSLARIASFNPAVGAAAAHDPTPGLSRLASLGSTMGGMGGSMENLNRMGSMTAMGGGMNLMGGMGGMDNMPGLTRLSSLSGAMGMNGMGGMTPMTAMGGMMPMTGATPMGGMGGMNGMMPMTCMGGMAPMMGGMTAMQPMAGMGGMGFGTTPMQALAAPQLQPATAPANTPADVASLLASLNTGNKQGSAGGAVNQDLVRMLADEVLRLRKALDDKRRYSVDNNNNGVTALRTNQI